MVLSGVNFALDRKALSLVVAGPDRQSVPSRGLVWRRARLFFAALSNMGENTIQCAAG